ncbi:ATP-binding protein [Streptomyces sp. NPDC048417]|uniref:ATP-binding protein n=1 Tax=Streptomyces sp. NPDC048417 TaxID=3155387 RepID=UPI0034493624
MTDLSPLYPQLPEKALIGASGAGKSVLASTWPDFQVLSLDTLRGWVSDDPGCQDASDDAVDALHLLVERRMSRRRNTVIDATNVSSAARAPLVAAAKRHSMPAIAVVLATPEDVCLARQIPRPDNRTVPDDTVRAQHKARVQSHQSLRGEGFNEVLFAENLYRLEPFLRSLSQARDADLGLNGAAGLGDLHLVRRIFGPEILPLWQWKDGSDVAGGDRVAEIRLGQLSLTLALRTDVDGEGDYGFDVMVPCPFDPECGGYAWVPAWSISCLHRALTGQSDNHEDIVCTVHGGFDDVDQEADDHAAQALEAVDG